MTTNSLKLILFLVLIMLLLEPYALPPEQILHPYHLCRYIEILVITGHHILTRSTPEVIS